MIEVSCKIDGLKDIEGMLLGALAPRVQKKILTEALTAGAEIIKRQAVANAPRKTGALKASIHVALQRTNKPGSVHLSVGTDSETLPGDFFYARFQEQGWIPVGPHKRREARRQKRAGNPGTLFLPRTAHYIERALTMTAAAVESAVERIITQRVHAITGDTI